MKTSLSWVPTVAVLVGLGVTGVAAGQVVALKDPTGDDDGPGAYTYPVDAVYTPGSFDLTGLTLKVEGDEATLEVGVNSALEDPWRMGRGFAVQMVFVFIKSDQAGGFTEGPPGLGVEFAPDATWNACIILSPQPPSRLEAEVLAKVPKEMQGAIIIPSSTRGAGRTISARVSLRSIGQGEPSRWGYQVVMQSNDNYPAATDLLTRKVNEFESQHRFGGGSDGTCDPHVLDLLAGAARGDTSEADAQHEMLKHDCGPDGTVRRRAVLRMVYPEARVGGRSST